MATSAGWRTVVEGYGNIANSAGGNDMEVAFKNYLVALKAAGHKMDVARLTCLNGGVSLTSTCEANLVDPDVYASYVAGTEK
jgi:hypothetical protein